MQVFFCIMMVLDGNRVIHYLIRVVEEGEARNVAFLVSYMISTGVWAWLAYAVTVG